MRKRQESKTCANIEAKLLLSVDDAAALMSLGKSLVHRLVMRGEIVSIKVGRMRRIPVKALQDYISQQSDAYTERGR